MKELEITAGIIKKDNQVLIGKRKYKDKFGGMWEFPGGKLEKSELPEDCLIREFKEELDIDLIKFSHLMSYVHESTAIKLIVHAFIIDSFSGQFKLTDHESIQWVDIKSLSNFNLLEADINIIKKLNELYES